MTPSPTLDADATWYDMKVIHAAKVENSKYEDTKRQLRRGIKDLRKTVSVIVAILCIIIFEDL